MGLAHEHMLMGLAHEHMLMIPAISGEAPEMGGICSETSKSHPFQISSKSGAPKMQKPEMRYDLGDETNPFTKRSQIFKLG